jgi:hypothetical protein
MVCATDAGVVGFLGNVCVTCDGADVNHKHRGLLRIDCPGKPSAVRGELMGGRELSAFELTTCALVNGPRLLRTIKVAAAHSGACIGIGVLSPVCTV